ncbi:MAG: hypothetical protein ABR553_02465 [Gammaproteobacteria bacterium]
MHLSIFGCHIHIDGTHRPALALAETNYRAFLSPPSRDTPDLLYRVDGEDPNQPSGLSLTRRGTRHDLAWAGLDAAEFLYVLEKDLTIELQRRRPQYYFLHAAALSRGDAAFLLVARSGGGKSTTCWGLLQEGCSYLSDELAPVDLDRLEVQPYPHALCLKSDPPGPAPLPQDTLRTNYTLHVPARALASAPVDIPVPLRAIFFVEYAGRPSEPSITPLPAAEASMLLYANALNPLSHPADGLDGSVTIATGIPAFRVSTGALQASAAAIIAAVDRCR